VYVAEVRLTGFRSYHRAVVQFSPGLNIVVGENATGKTNLLEGAYYALRGASPRTRREDKLVAWGAAAARAEVRLRGDDGSEHTMDVAYAPRQGKRGRVDGAAIAAADELRSRSHVFIFVPESLLLIKGSPARRRAHIDAFAATCEPAYEAAHNDLQHVLRQRNAQLARVREGASGTALDPWDTQLARTAVELGRRRREVIARLAGPFATTAAALAPTGGRFELRLVSQLDETGFDEGAVIEVLRARRQREITRGLSTFGPHRDDLLFVEIAGCAMGEAGLPPQEGPGGEADSPPEPAGAAALRAAVATADGDRDLRLFGSQGEQRAAVLALLLAEQAVAAKLGGDTGILFLDDVMSEFDDPRRRLLVAELMRAGQALVTTTNRHYFTDAELSAATVIELPLADG
jgi:DNA replication and repair protein RecF